MPRDPSMDDDQRRLLAADEGAGAQADLDVEVPGGAEDALAEEAGLTGLGDGELQALDRQRILRADVDEALPRADGVAADDHALDDGVRVALDGAAVHERPGVALVGVADDVLLVALLDGGVVPLHTRGEAATAAAAQTRPGDCVDDLLGRHLGEHPHGRFVAPHDQVFVQPLGVDARAVAERHPELMPEEVGVAVHGPEAVGQARGLPMGVAQTVGAGFVADRHGVLLDRRAFEHVRLEDLDGLGRTDQGVLDRGRALGADGHHRLHVAPPGAAHPAQADVADLVLVHQLAQPVEHRRGPRRVLARSRAHGDAHAHAELLGEKPFLGLPAQVEQTIKWCIHTDSPETAAKSVAINEFYLGRRTVATPGGARPGWAYGAKCEKILGTGMNRMRKGPPCGYSC